MAAGWTKAGEVQGHGPSSARIRRSRPDRREERPLSLWFRAQGKALSSSWRARNPGPAGRANLIRVSAKRIEQRTRLRKAEAPPAATLLVRGGPDTVEKLRRHAERTARAWALDGRPLYGISVFAVLDMPLNDLLRRRFTSFRTIYLPTVGRLAECRFELFPTGQRPHFTIRLQRADDSELDRLLTALGVTQPNPQYARGMIWREEG